MIVLKCKLKPNTKDNIFIAGERRPANSCFEIENPAEGVELNIQEYCETEKIELPDKPQLISDNKNKDIVIKELKETIIKLENEIGELKAKISIQEKNAQPQEVQEVQDIPKTRKRTKK